jgi:hypothetical protein
MAQNPNIDDDTRARARKFVEEGGTSASAPKKSRTVSKKELDASGLSLRDFLNRERGLTRRADKSSKSTSTKSELGPEMGESMSRAESQDVVSRMGGTPRSNYSNEGRNAGSARLNSAENKTELSDMMKRGGKVKGYAKGGVTRADGCITKGHTKGRVI